MNDELDPQLRDALAALPRDIQPPPHVREAVLARIAETPGTLTDGAAPVRRPAWYARPPMLTAAAVVLVALSSAVTAVLLRDPSAADQPISVGPDVMDASPAGDAVTLVAVSAMERSYQDAIAELQRAVRDQQSALSPETLRVLQANLDVIDRALAEARAALHADPGNDALTALVRSGYERKLDVLRSVSSHGRGRL